MRMRVTDLGDKVSGETCEGDSGGPFKVKDAEGRRTLVGVVSGKKTYSRDHKFVVFCFALLLPQILDKFQNQCQFWNLLVLTISKHPLHVQFDQVLAEIMEVKDT